MKVRHELQVSAGYRINDDGVFIADTTHGLQVRKSAALSGFDISQDTTCSADSTGLIRAIESGEILHTKLLQKITFCLIVVKLPERPQLDGRGLIQGIAHRMSVGNEQFRRRKARQFALENGLVATLEDLKATTAYFDDRKTETLVDLIDGADQTLMVSVKQSLLGQRAWCHDSDHLPFYGPFTGRWISYLLTDRDRDACLNEATEIAVRRMIRDTAHRYRLPARMTATGQRNI